MKKHYLVFLLAILNLINLPAQTSFSGVFRDKNTNEPIPCIHVQLYGDQHYYYGSTDDSGHYKIMNIEPGTYEISYYHPAYYPFDYRKMEIKSGTNYTEEVYVEKRDVVDYSSSVNNDISDIGLEFDFFSPDINSVNRYFISNYAAAFHMEGRFKMTNRIGIGIKYIPIKISWNNIKTDTLFTSIPHSKERYYEVSTSLYLYTRFIISNIKKTGKRGLFFDLGLGYNLPYLFTYDYYPEKNAKVSQKGIHNFKDLNAMFRLGYSWGSIKATYRLFDILNSPYIQPPRLNIGVEINLVFKTFTHSAY